MFCKRSMLLWMIPLMMMRLSAQDSLVRFSEIKFDSEFERSEFTKYLKQNDQTVAINLLLATSADGPARLMAVNNRLEEVVKNLKSSGLQTKKPDKQVKMVNDQLKSNFLKNYHPTIGFGEIFSNNFYNSLTATVLYALLFDQIKIPYAVQENSTKVFLIAYPDQQKIAVETTPLAYNYRIFNAEYQQSFVTDLKKAHRISDAESTAFTTEGLFERHFFANRNLNLTDLIGLHYLHDAYLKSDNQDYIGAFKQCEKSYLFYPSPRCGFILTSLVAQILQSNNLKPKERAMYVAKASRYTDFGITTEMVKGEFIKLNDELLLRQNDRVLYQQCADIIVENGLQEDEIKDGIRFIQHVEIGRAFYNQGRYALAKESFVNALKIQPDNPELSAIFFSSLTFSMRNMDGEAAVLDTVQSYKMRFPTLSQNNNFNALLANAYLIASAAVMDNGNLKLAEQHVADFEKMYAEDKTLLIDNNQAGTTYSKLCTYYFKKGQKDKAKAILKKGLEIAPDSYELRIRKQMIN